SPAAEPHSALVERFEGARVAPGETFTVGVLALSRRFGPHADAIEIRSNAAATPTLAITVTAVAVCESFAKDFDSDQDGIPDACDVCWRGDDALDADADTIPDACDVCPDADDRLDADLDGTPDACDVCADADDRLDADFDTVPDACDQCPFGSDLSDDDLDGVPDFCDGCAGEDDRLDADGDTIADACDVCEAGDDRLDGDGDLVPDACDVCSLGDDALDADGDTVPDACDVCILGDDALDADGDTVPDACDRCEGSDDRADTDLDTIPDGCDVPQPAPVTSQGLAGFWQVVSGPTVLGDPVLTSQWATHTFVAFEDDDGDGRGAIEVLGRYAPPGSLQCAVTGTYVEREQGDVWFDIDVQIAPFLADVEAGENVLTIERPEGRGVFQRVERIPEEARCQDAVEQDRFEISAPGLSGWLGYDGFDLFIGTTSRTLRPISLLDGTLGAEVALDADFDLPLAFQGPGLWAERPVRDEIALLDPLPQVDRILDLQVDLGLDMNLRYGAVDGDRLYLLGRDQQTGDRLVTVDLAAPTPTVLNDVPFHLPFFGLLVHDGALWTVDYQDGETALGELDPATGLVSRTVRLPDASYVRGLVDVRGTLYATVLRGVDEDLVAYVLPAPRIPPTPPSAETAPELGLTVTPTSLALLPGTTGRLQVEVDRTDLLGTVEVSVTGLPPGVTSDVATLEPGLTVVEVWLEASASLERDRAPAIVSVAAVEGSDAAATDVALRFAETVPPGGEADALPVLELPVNPGDLWAGDIVLDSQGGRLAFTVSHDQGLLVSRLYSVLPEGTLDPTFGTAGMLDLSGQRVDNLVILPDDGFVISGNDVANGWTQFLERYDAVGGRIQAFHANTASVLQSSTQRPRATFLDGDGLVFGDSDVVRRFDLDGHEDPSVRYEAEFPGSIVAAGPDGAGGVYVSLNWPFEYDAPQVDRIDASGQPVPSFGSAGRVALPADLAYTGALHYLPLDGGSALVLALSYRGASIFRLDESGALDPTFGTGGVLETLRGAWSPYPPPLVRIGEQFVVAAGTSREDGPIVARRFDLDGTPDPTFGLTEMVDLPACPTGMVYDPVSDELTALVLHQSEARVELVQIPL
ncbi:MAG: hypothetical protein AAF602_05540, partial [Myxococcota bacterium]